MVMVVDKLIDFSSSQDEELRDISGLGARYPQSSVAMDSDIHPALKTITSELPLEGKIASKACEKLTPKLLTQLSNVSSHLLDITLC